MKTIMNIKYMLLAVAIIVGLVACKDSEDPISNRVFLHEASGLEVSSSFVIPDEGTQVVVTPRIAQALDKDLEIEVFVNESALETYNKKNGTTYQLMDQGRYSLSVTKTVIPAGKVLAEPVYVSLDALIPEENKSGFIYALPLAVKAADNSLPSLESSSTFFYAAMPVPMADVPQLQKYCIMQLPLSQDYELENWTYEMLFNASAFTSSSPTFAATASGYNATGGSGIANGFFLRLGDAGTKGNILNGRIQFAGKGTGKVGLNTGIWHHIAIVCANKNITVYVDGVANYTISAGLDKVKFVKEQGIRLAGENRTGTNIAVSTRYRYSQVRLWGEARSVEQLKNNMYGVPEDSPNLLGYWKLDSYTTGKTMVNKSDTDLKTSAEKMEIDTYFFKDYTGNNPDGFIDRNPASNPGGLLFDKNKRIEVGYRYDGTKP
ncbi:DUF1735 domain-containing protein [Dysgonomonas sp. 511]|uniref:BT_3987 domain-containing protein n=1 Tax=Dysgonomonas sp. 511 TaxID=2302930 RepID=UPI0013D27469|nr:DUF1735 domain-containing protein [Dysgonomonas sp. 511]NDV79317.1 DUF1735 domain-containing protein [Dysgonomonas sp. 511]